MRTIPLHGAKAAGRVALVDDADYDLVMQYRWYVFERQRPSGNTDGPYAIANFVRADGTHTMLKMHKLITGWPRTDHQDHDGLNNQRSNLRSATAAQNNHNQRPYLGRTSSYKGVYWYKRGQGKWRAQIGSPTRFLGYFLVEEDAARAYDAAAQAAWGEFACLNFPRD